MVDIENNNIMHGINESYYNSDGIEQTSAMGVRKRKVAGDGELDTK